MPLPGNALCAAGRQTMEGRWKSLLAGSILFGLVGCETVHTTRPSGTSEPPLVSRKPPVEAKDNTPPKLETLIAWANVRLSTAAMPDRSERDRDQNVKEAQAAYQQILRRDPKNLDGMLGMARSYKIMEEKDSCVAWYQKAAKAVPTNASIWGEMGQALEVLHDRDAAIHCYHIATQIDPDNKDYKKTLGFALARAGRYEEGICLAEPVRAPGPTPIFLVGVRMMDHNGQQRLSQQALCRRCSRMDPNNENGPNGLE